MTKTESRISNKKTLVNVSLELLHMFFLEEKRKENQDKKTKQKNN